MPETGTRELARTVVLFGVFSSLLVAILFALSIAAAVGIAGLGALAVVATSAGGLTLGGAFVAFVLWLRRRYPATPSGASRSARGQAWAYSSTAVALSVVLVLQALGVVSKDGPAAPLLVVVLSAFVLAVTVVLTLYAPRALRQVAAIPENQEAIDRARIELRNPPVGEAWGRAPGYQRATLIAAVGTTALVLALVVISALQKG